MGNKGSLTVVGSGIQVTNHLTPIARASIVRANTVLTLTSDPVTNTMIRRLNPATKSLNVLYKPGQNRAIIYRAIIRRILSPVRQGHSVCVVTYGHPGYFVDATRHAIRIARAEGYEAVMHPGISSVDCLFADLGFDPGQLGCHTYEATGFLLQSRHVDTTCPLILLQFSFAGDLTHKKKYGRGGLQALTQLLVRHYGRDHEVVIYEAAQYPFAEPWIQPLALEAVPKARTSIFSTLFVPPKSARKLDLAMLKKLKISRKALSAS